MLGLLGRRAAGDAQGARHPHEPSAVRGYILRAIIGREWREILRNRLLLFSLIFPPIILSVLPIVLVSLAGSEPKIPAGAVAQIVAAIPRGPI